MLRWLGICAVVVVVAAAGLYLVVGLPRPTGNEGDRDGKSDKGGGRDLHAGGRVAPRDGGGGAPLPAGQVGAVPLIVIADGRVAAIDKQDVPCQHDGQLLFIGTEPTAGEELPPKDVMRHTISYLMTKVTDKEKGKFPAEEKFPESWRKYKASEAPGAAIIFYRPLEENEPVEPANVLVRSEERLFRRLREGDEVAEGQLLGLVNPSLARDDLVIKKAKLQASIADLQTSEKTRDEAEARYEASVKLRSMTGFKGIADEEVRGNKLAWDRYKYEAISKGEAIKVSAAELKQTQTILGMHELRSKIPGKIKVIYKNKGDAVKNLDPVMQIYNPKKLRIEGLVEMQYVNMLREGDPVVVEPTRFCRPKALLRGHLQDITGVAVSKDSKAIVSASEDRTLRVWDAETNTEQRRLYHPTAVKAVACTPRDADKNLCLTGAADGVARLWDLDDSKATEPVRELKDGHKGTINCVAFGPKGTWCATGGDDRAICLWNTANGELLKKLAAAGREYSRNGSGSGGSPGHRGAVTSLQFLSETQLVSAGSDKTMMIWTLKNDGSVDGVPAVLDRRTGDVPVLCGCAGKKQVLFDNGRELRVLTLPDRHTVGVLQNASGAMNFTTMALFSPDGQSILTAGGSEGRLQLWRAPDKDSRPYELCQLVYPAAAATCGAFSPDDKFLVTGTRDRQVVVWPAPPEPMKKRLTAKIQMIEMYLDSNSRQVRIWADLDDPQDLIPGATATMVVYPR
jgi:WD40 repeat protein